MHWCVKNLNFLMCQEIKELHLERGVVKFSIVKKVTTESAEALTVMLGLEKQFVGFMTTKLK